MTHYEDLSTYAYSESVENKTLLNIGWLGRDISFPRGVIPTGFVERLAVAGSPSINLMRGTHYCSVCPEHTYEDHSYWSVTLDRNIWLGMSEIDILGEGNIIYVAPSLIIHYIEAHDYLPPQEYMDAVMKMSVDEYLEISKTIPHGQPRVELYG